MGKTTQIDSLAFLQSLRVSSKSKPPARFVHVGPVLWPMKNPCLEYRCIECCLNTEMPLSQLDIVQIINLGFSENFFMVKRNGNRQLRNSEGRCVFHNGQRCIIYKNRPEGCRLYPIILDEETGEAVPDGHCPHHKEFPLTQGISCEVIKLVRKLDVERKRRLRSRNAEELQHR